MNKDFKRVYIGYTAYSLYLYLLYSSYEEIEDTFFFVGDGIHKSIRDQLRNKYHFNSKEYEKKKPLARLIYRIRLRYRSAKQWPFLKTAQLFAQDHFFYCRGLIGKRAYTLIEDAPNIFTCHRAILNSLKFPPIVSFKTLLLGTMENSYAGEMGDNPFCKAVLITNMESDPILTGKQLIQIREMESWNRSAETKQHKILSIFNIAPKDLSQLKKRKVILLTQNFATLGYVSEQELIDIYAERLNKYPQDEILIKNHPLDKVDYQKYFPKAYIFDKIVPMQLLNLLGIRYETAITICSSAAFSFPYPIRIEWIGTRDHEKLLAALGPQDIKTAR